MGCRYRSCIQNCWHLFQFKACPPYSYDIARVYKQRNINNSRTWASVSIWTESSYIITSDKGVGSDRFNGMCADTSVDFFEYDNSVSVHEHSHCHKLVPSGIFCVFCQAIWFSRGKSARKKRSKQIVKMKFFSLTYNY